jgi:hypothetical protein
VADEIGELLGVKLVVILIGERPGLSSPDSMGLYLTWMPARGLTDASRNCISNVRPEGLAYAEAAYKLHYLMAQAHQRGLSGVAPYFVDADKPSAEANAAVAPDAQKPVGGLTVIAFHNSHLVYALTWYALALMSLGAGYWVIRDERRWRQRIQDARAQG